MKGHIQLYRRCMFIMLSLILSTGPFTCYAADSGPVPNYKFLGFVLSLLTTMAVYSGPVFIYRYFIRKRPIERKWAFWIALAYGCISPFIMLGIMMWMMRTTGITEGYRVGSAIYLWSFINYFMLKGGCDTRKKPSLDVSSDNTNPPDLVPVSDLPSPELAQLPAEELTLKPIPTSEAAPEKKSGIVISRLSAAILATICIALVALSGYAGFTFAEEKYKDLAAQAHDDGYEQGRYDGITAGYKTGYLNGYNAGTESSIKPTGKSLADMVRSGEIQLNP